MKSKKLLSIILTGVTAIGLMTGCGTSNSSQSASTNDNKTSNVSENDSTATEQVSETTENTDTATAGGKTLVVYYSATGNTKNVAETIAQVTGGDLFEIEPKEPYTDEDLNWTNDDNR